MSMRYWWLCALLTLVLGCQGAFDITMTKAELPHPSFEIRPRSEPSARPKFHSVRVVDDENKEVIWQLRAKPFGTSASQARLVYGSTPSGFEVVTSSQALNPGRSYTLIVSGKEHGQLKFQL